MVLTQLCDGAGPGRQDLWVPSISQMCGVLKGAYVPLPWAKKLGWCCWGALFLCSHQRGWLPHLW